MALVILDTTVLSNFAHIRRPELLRAALGSDAVTSAVVLAELRAGEALGLVPHCDWLWLAVAALTEEEQALAAAYDTQLDVGEAACLAVARSREGTFLTDDLAARRLAQSQGVAVSGTIGVLRQLVASEHLSLAEADQHLETMISFGYRSPIRSLGEL